MSNSLHNQKTIRTKFLRGRNKAEAGLEKNQIAQFTDKEELHPNLTIILILEG
jgi:hypothetical protein